MKKGVALNTYSMFTITDYNFKIYAITKIASHIKKSTKNYAHLFLECSKNTGKYFSEFNIENPLISKSIVYFHLQMKFQHMDNNPTPSKPVKMCYKFLNISSLYATFENPMTFIVRKNSTLLLFCSNVNRRVAWPFPSSAPLKKKHVLFAC
jgi:hypothetical protein